MSEHVRNNGERADQTGDGQRGEPPLRKGYGVSQRISIR